MSNDIHRKRDFVVSLYPGPRWREKVRKMPDSQVVAIYLREHNKAEKPPKPEPDVKESEAGDDIPF